MAKGILITGGSGYIGSQVVSRLAEMQADRDLHIVSLDIQPYPKEAQKKGVVYLQEDLRETELVSLMKDHKVEVVIHLAAIVMPTNPVPRDIMYAVDVEGTQSVLDACLATGVRKIITTSSGAAYGYFADNPEWLTEEDPIRGNVEFAYAYHKRLVEEMMHRYHKSHPALEQTILRIGAILGKTTDNQITRLFAKNPILGIMGTDSPFVIIWDQDLVRLLSESIFSPKTGIFNVAGDGALSIRKIAAIQGKRCLKIPAWLVRAALAVGKPLGLAPYGPEQVRFMQYRPVLSNRKLKEVFGFIPEKSSRETLQFYLEHRDKKTREE